MGFRKFAVGEQMDLFTDAETEVVKDTLRRTGKTAAKDLSEQEKAEMRKELDDLNTQH